MSNLLPYYLKYCFKVSTEYLVSISSFLTPFRPHVAPARVPCRLPLDCRQHPETYHQRSAGLSPALQSSAPQQVFTGCRGTWDAQMNKTHTDPSLPTGPPALRGSGISKEMAWHAVGGRRHAEGKEKVHVGRAGAAVHCCCTSTGWAFSPWHLRCAACWLCIW